MTAAVEDPPQNGHARRRAVTREKILAATRDIVAAGGREALTIVDVARRAGVSEGTVYKIFANRDDLAAAAMLRVSDTWIEAVAATPSTQHPLRRIHRAHREILREVAEEEVLLWSAAAMGPKTTTELGLRYQAQEMLVRSCATGLTRSARSKLSSDEAVLWSQVYVAVLRTLRSIGALPDDDLDVIATHLDTLIS